MMFKETVTGMILAAKSKTKWLVALRMLKMSA